ncbi:MAG: hypothetical protein ABJA87_10765 [bacterium]
MTDPTTDPRAVSTYRIPARTLRAGDLVNTGGSEDDWQQVLAVWTPDSPPADEPAIAGLVTGIGDRYVLVEMTDIAPVDSNVYFADGTAYVYGADGEPDAPVEETVDDGSARRNYLYTLHELVTVRAAR